ncbi:hypothetical protein NADE_008788 [Nannochloris sp. 'desiccata']|nr:hypothetical protein NADE_008788 [Chlorella desiccata (nom. nud.)]
MRGDLGNWLIEKANAAKRVISPSKSNGSPSKSSGSGEPSQSNKRSRQLDFNDVTEDGLQQIDLTESPPEEITPASNVNASNQASGEGLFYQECLG